MTQYLSPPARPSLFQLLKTFVETRLVADTPPLSHAESGRSALGALMGLALAGGLLYLNPDASFWLIAPIGASAIILFILEVKIVSHGVLTIGGVIAMIIGSLMLFETPGPFVKLSLYLICLLYTSDAADE